MNGLSTTVSGLTPARYFFISGITLAVLFAVLEPAGSRGMGFMPSLMLWMVQMALLIPLCITVQRWLMTRRAELSNLPWLHTFLAGLIAATLYTPIGYALDLGFGLGGALNPNLGLELLDEWTGVAPPVVICWLALNAPWILKLSFIEPSVKEITAITQETESSLPDLYSHLPPEIGTDIVFIEAELHYIKVVTVDGETLVLYALRDAAMELSQGVIIHRSYWVALEFIEKISGTRASPVCVLKDGRRLPISRRRLDEVNNLYEQYLKRKAS